MRPIGTLIALVIAVAIVSTSPVLAASQPDITRKVLDNGLTVVVKPEPGSGLVAVVAAIRAGAAQESIQTAGLGGFVAQLLLAGTRLSSAEEVASVADEVGGNMSANWHPDFTDIRAITTSRMFNKAMDLIGECLTESNFEDKWVEQVRSDLLRRFKTDTANVFDSAYTDMRNMLYQDNGYRRPMLGFERTIKQATIQDLRKFFAMYYVPNNIVITVVGDITVDQALDRADKAFAGIPTGKLPVDRGVPDEKLERSAFRASEKDISAAYLLMGWLAPGITSGDYPAMLVATNALGGGKGSLMFRELRQKRGMGYDVGTIYPRFRYQSHVGAYVYTDPYKTVLPQLKGGLVLDEVKSALLEQVETLRQAPLSAKDLQRAKGYTIGTYALSQQHLIERAFQIAMLEAVGVGSEMYRKLPDEIEKVSAEDVQRVSRKYFDKYAAVVLMPKTRSPQSGAGKN